MNVLSNKTQTVLSRRRVAALDSRSAVDHDAAHPVGEAVGEQAGHVVVQDLHLAALELSDLVQADLVLLLILEEREGRG